MPLMQTSTIASFTYDGDGRQVKAVVGGVTTYYVGAHYQVDNGVVTKYYFAGAQRVAMRKNGTLYYLLADHLGSTSITTNTSGALVSELRYKAWGETRYSSGTTPTSYRYTGQRDDSYINLLWYGSRHYDPALGRFTSPDSIVPIASQGVQAWDRYAYVNNAPTRYTDPTGHRACGDGEDINCETGLLNNPSNHKNKGCGGSGQISCLGKPTTEEGKLRELIRQEINRRFDPFTAWLSAGFNYEASEYPTYDYYAEQAYEQAGFDLFQIASQNQDNPMTLDDWENSDVDIDYIYSKGVRGQPPGHKFFLNYMGRDINNPSNYEANYLNALMETHEIQVDKAKTQYIQQLISQHGSLQAVWDYLQITMDAMGPDT